MFEIQLETEILNNTIYDSMKKLLKDKSKKEDISKMCRASKMPRVFNRN